MSPREECSHSIYFAQYLDGWESKDKETPKAVYAKAHVQWVQHNQTKRFAKYFA